MINIYDDRIEFVSLGGLVSGLSVEAIFMGVSQSRNPNLAAVFYRMRLIESYGTGIGKIIRLYQDMRHKPQFDTATGAFRVILPNRNESQEYSVREDLTYAVPVPTRLVTNQKEQLYLYAKQHGGITRKEAENLLQSKQTKAYHLLKQLCTDGKLILDGTGKNRIYLPASDN